MARRPGQNSLSSEIDRLSDWLRKTGITLDAALQKDKDRESKAEERYRWFHDNTNRNLAEFKLREGGCSSLEKML